MSYLPHGGSVFPQLTDELKGYSTSLGALRFGIDERFRWHWSRS